MKRIPITIVTDIRHDEASLVLTGCFSTSVVSVHKRSTRGSPSQASSMHNMRLVLIATSVFDTTRLNELQY